MLKNGDLIYYFTGDIKKAVNIPVVTDGAYVKKGNLSDKIKLFKIGTTNINRIKVLFISYNITFQNIRDFIAADGTGLDITLYRNFKILKAK